MDIRAKWPHEALDFTPWLARNLHLLNKPTGMSLQLVRQEAPVGPFFCDILAKEADSGALVVIENQLEWSDHSHLTQLLTYAAGLDARAGIWVASDFRYEDAETLHWLNQWTRDKLNFYGVKIELVQTGDGPPEPQLCTVVSPEGWNKEVTLPRAATRSPRGQQFQAFFQPLIGTLLRTGFAERETHHYAPSGRRFPSGLNQGIGFAAEFTEGRNDAWVTLHIQTHDRELTKQVFDQLMINRESIESEINDAPGQEWRWNRHTRYTFSSINIRRDGSIDYPQERLDETRA